MLFRRFRSELFDAFKNIILLRIFPLENIYSWKMLRQLKLKIPRQPLAARYNWCQGPVPGRRPAVEKHCYTLYLTWEGLVLPNFTLVWFWYGCDWLSQAKTSSLDPVALQNFTLQCLNFLFVSVQKTELKPFTCLRYSTSLQRCCWRRFKSAGTLAVSTG
jgi:hypothetical protein